MRDQLPNAVWGVLDYAAYPAAMLTAAPTLLHHLGAAQYGLWIVCTAAISTGGIIASGFGDANIQHVATQRSAANPLAISTAVRNMMGIHATLGFAVTLLALGFIPTFTRHITSVNPALYPTALVSLTLAGLLMWLRAIESVCISTQRAFERYGPAVAVSIVVRVATIAAAVLITTLGLGVASIMVFTFAAVALGTAIQLFQLKKLLNSRTLFPRFDREAFRAVFGFGIFAWLQAVSTVLFTQADRLVLALTLGAAAVTSYALCVQIAQPIYGIAAAALHFLFPYLAARSTSNSTRPILIAFLLNLAYTTLAAGTLLIFGNTVLRIWLGPATAAAATPVLAPIVFSFALLSLSIPAYYALLAFARIRAVTTIGLVGGIVMLLVLANAATLGLRGIAFARILYGLISLSMYAPLWAALHQQQKRSALPLASGRA